MDTKKEDSRDAVQVLVEDLPKVGMLLCDVMARCRKVREEKGVNEDAAKGFDGIADKLNEISNELLKLYKPIFLAAKTAHAMAMIKIIVLKEAESENKSEVNPNLN